MATLRFTTTEIVTYSKSNGTKNVSFATLDEAIKHVFNQDDLHPRSKKKNPMIQDTKTGKCDTAYHLAGQINRNELPECWK